jgi:hypothetical protein
MGSLPLFGSQHNPVSGGLQWENGPMCHCARSCHLTAHGPPQRTAARILQRGKKKERAVPGKTSALFKEEKGESDPIRWPSVKIQYNRLSDRLQ